MRQAEADRLTETTAPPNSAPRPLRAYAKMLAVSVTLAVIIAGLATLVSHEHLNGLRRHLTLWLIIVLVAAINVIAFLLFALFWAIYRWIKRDLDPDYED